MPRQRVATLRALWLTKQNKRMEEMNMSSTALGAENTKKQSIRFINEAHEKFYYEKLKEVQYQGLGHLLIARCFYSL